MMLNETWKEQYDRRKRSIERLKQIGYWMKVNHDAIYGTTASPFKRLAWGRCTTKVASKIPNRFQRMHTSRFGAEFKSGRIWVASLLRHT